MIRGKFMVSSGLVFVEDEHMHSKREVPYE